MEGTCVFQDLSEPLVLTLKRGLSVFELFQD